MDWFNKEYVHTKKIFPKELLKIYKDAFDNRMDADYSIFVNFTKDEVVENYDNVKSFVEIIEQHILKKIEN